MSFRSVHLRPRQVPRWPRLLAVLGLVASALLVPTGVAVAEEESGAVEVTGGTFDWGLNATYRNYVPGTPNGKITLSDGLTENADGTYRWTVTEGTFEPDTGATDVHLAGTVNFYGHSGLMDLTLSDLHLVSSGYGKATLYADYRSKVDGEFITGDDVDLATIDASVGGTVTVPEGELAWDAVNAILASGAVPAFAGFYGAGQSLDPITLSFTGECPAAAVETWAEHGVAAVAVGTRIAPPAGVTWSGGVVIDAERGVAFASASSGDIYVYDVATKELRQILTGVVWRAINRRTGEILVSVGGTTGPGTFYAPDDQGTYAATSKTLPTSITPLSVAIHESSGTVVYATGSAKALYTLGADGTYTLARTYATATRTRGNPVFFDQSTGELIGVYESRDSTSLRSSLLTYDVGEDSLTLTRTDVLDLYASAASYWAEDPAKGSRFATGIDYQINAAGTEYVIKGYKINSYVDGKLSGAVDFGPTDQVGSFLSLDAEHDVLFNAGVGYLGVYDVSDPAAPRKVVTGSWSTDDVSNIANASQVAAAGDGRSAWVSHFNALLVASYGVTPKVSGVDESVTVKVPEGAPSAGLELSADVAGEDVSLQWQRKVPGDIAFRDIEGETAASLSADVTASDSGTQYRLVASNDFGRVVSQVSTVQVQQLASPTIVTQASDVTVAEGADASFSVAAGGTPLPEISWQRRVGGYWQNIASDDENFVVDGSGLTVKETNTDQSGSLFRAKVVNEVGSVYSRTAKLTVNAAVTIPEEGLNLDGVSLEWSGNAEVQAKPPYGASNYLSAGVSDGSEGTYRATDDDVEVVHVDAEGAETAASYGTRAAQVAGDVTQVVKLGGGSAKVKADGSATVEWDGAFSVNFYDGLVPFTLTDPELTVDADGRGTLTADLSGYASSQENPEERTPLDPVDDVTVATFADVEIDPAGKVTVDPDYAAVELDVSGDEQVQNRTVEGWGSWPQEFVDFHFKTGLSSYWYSSGGTADPKKPPSPFTVDFTDAQAGAGVRAPVITGGPVSQTATVGSDVTLSVTATGDDLVYRWQKRIGSLWIDIPDETASSLKLSDAVVEDAGSYRVRVSNEAGTVTSGTASLIVAKRPSTVALSVTSATYGKAATVTVGVPGRSGQVTLSGAGTAQTTSLSGGKASFRLPRNLAARAYTLRATYAGDNTNASATASKRLTVKRAKVSFRSAKVTKKPTSKRAGRARVVVRSSTGVLVRGKIKVTLSKKGQATKRVTGTLRGGRATVRLPTLAKGTWKAEVTYPRSTNFATRSKTIKVRVSG